MEEIAAAAEEEEAAVAEEDAGGLGGRRGEGTEGWVKKDMERRLKEGK